VVLGSNPKAKNIQKKLKILKFSFSGAVEACIRLTVQILDTLYKKKRRAQKLAGEILNI
jgi:hypothetical protein